MTHIAAGSSNRFVYVWDFDTQKYVITGLHTHTYTCTYYIISLFILSSFVCIRLVYELPGHTGSVNAVDFHPDEPIILSGSSDKKIYLGEIDI